MKTASQLSVIASLAVHLFVFSFDTLAAEVFAPDLAPQYTPYAHRPPMECESAKVEVLRQEIAQRWRARTSMRELVPTNLAELEPNSQEWLRIIRRSAQDPLAEHFAKNALDSLRSEFYPWLAGAETSDPMEMLHYQYLLLVLGRDGRSSYTGLTVKRDLHIVALATMRGRFASPGTPDLIYPFHRKVIYDVRLNDFLDRQVRDEWIDVELQGISSKGVPKFKIVDEHILVKFPRSEHLGEYRDQMNKQLLRIRELAQNGDRDSIIPLLARYYQLGVFAHLFPIANTSLYHLQANGVLMSLGMATIPPQFLDHHGYIMDSNWFGEFFSLAAKQPDQ